MAKMTKAKARKRILEASRKLSLVQQAANTGELGMGIQDIKKLFPMQLELLKIADKLK